VSLSATRYLPLDIGPFIEQIVRVRHEDVTRRLRDGEFDPAGQGVARGQLVDREPPSGGMGARSWIGEGLDLSPRPFILFAQELATRPWQATLVDRSLGRLPACAGGQ
jgi:hypothetical protein